MCLGPPSDGKPDDIRLAVDISECLLKAELFGGFGVKSLLFFAEVLPILGSLS